MQRVPLDVPSERHPKAPCSHAASVAWVLHLRHQQPSGSHIPTVSDSTCCCNHCAPTGSSTLTCDSGVDMFHTQRQKIKSSFSMSLSCILCFLSFLSLLAGCGAAGWPSAPAVCQRGSCRGRPSNSGARGRCWGCSGVAAVVLGMASACKRTSAFTCVCASQQVHRPALPTGTAAAAAAAGAVARCSIAAQKLRLQQLSFQNLRTDQAACNRHTGAAAQSGHKLGRVPAEGRAECFQLPCPRCGRPGCRQHPVLIRHHWSVDLLVNESTPMHIALLDHSSTGLGACACGWAEFAFRAVKHVRTLCIVIQACCVIASGPRPDSTAAAPHCCS